MVRASARQWKIASAKCVVTEQQGVDVKIELIAVPTHLHQQRARLPPGVSFSLYQRQGRGMNLPNTSLWLRWSLEWHTPVMWVEKTLSRLTSHHCSHDILFPTNAAYSLLRVQRPVKSPALFLPRGGCFNGTGGIHARSMRSFGIT